MARPVLVDLGVVVVSENVFSFLRPKYHDLPFPFALEVPDHHRELAADPEVKISARLVRGKIAARGKTDVGMMIPVNRRTRIPEDHPHADLVAILVAVKPKARLVIGQELPELFVDR